MFECYGWISVSETDETREANIISMIEKTFAENAALNFNTDGRYMNGTYKASIIINTNHAGPWKWIESLYKHIAETSQSAYGLVMFWNDEDEMGWDNEFQTWVLKRGSFAFEKDKHLSPCNPVIADPDAFA